MHGLRETYDFCRLMQQNIEKNIITLKTFCSFWNATATQDIAAQYWFL